MHDTNSQNFVKSGALRWVLICVGWLAVAAGVAGIILPLVPAIPFLLLAVVCFSRSSARFHHWLVEHKRLGPLVRDYVAYGGIPLKLKIAVIAMIWISFPVTAFLFVTIFWVRILLLATATGITAFLLYLPSTSPVAKDRAE